MFHRSRVFALKPRFVEPIHSFLSACEYQILKWCFPRSRAAAPVPEDRYTSSSRLRLLLGDRVVEDLKGKVVIDFGCGEGQEAVDLARSGVARVIGVDIRDNVLSTARRRAIACGVDDVCEFTTHAESLSADAIISIDAFEHFADPVGILGLMHDLLRVGGEVLISFGPPWFHPAGGHLFSVFPWAHLVFTEDALIRWRSDFKSDGAQRFAEVEGGLNQMTIRRFEQLVSQTPFELERLETVPIRALRKVHSQLTREFTTSIVRCQLRKTQRN